MPAQFKTELYRKLIHFSSIWIVLLYIYSSEDVVLATLPPLALTALMIDLSRLFIPSVNKIINIIFGKVLREKEKEHSLSGATYLLISSTISIVYFSKEIAVFALSVLIISDGIAALIGKKFGKHHFLDKSLEGSISFAASAILIYYFLITFYHFNLPLMGSLLAIAVATFAEIIAKKIHIDDNLIIPLSIGLILNAFS